MNDLLFQSVPQQEGPITEGETTFQFLQRGGRGEAVQIRQWMEEWFQQFPFDQKKKLKHRLQSEDFGEFMSAYFELQVFAILRRLDCTVEVEPSFPQTNGTVDFHVTNYQEHFYVEATVCGVGRGILSSNTNEQNVVRKITEQLKDPHSDVWLSATGELNRTLGKKCVVEPFEELLKTYTADDVRRLYSKLGWAVAQNRLSTAIKEGDWVLEGYLAPPIASDGRGQIRGPGRVGVVDGSPPLAKALEKKAEDWGKKKLEKEIFLIAVNVCHSEFWWGDEREAIFGRSTPISEQEAFSEPLSRVSGVIVFGNAVLGAERNSRVKLYTNMGKRIPECLRFLLQERSLGELLATKLS